MSSFQTTNTAPSSGQGNLNQSEAGGDTHRPPPLGMTLRASGKPGGTCARMVPAG